MTMYDIARLANVSVATVSRVINNCDNVKKDTRLKVLKIIQENNFIPNAQARRLSTQNSRIIGVMVPDVQNPFFQKLILGITDTAYKYNLSIVLYNTKEDLKIQHNLLDIVKQERLSGLIAVPVMQEDEETKNSLKWLEKNNVPIVLIDRDIDGVNFDRIFSNDFKGAYNSIKAFVNQGHKNIAIINGPLTSKPGLERYRGFVNAMNDFGIKINLDYVKSGNFMSDKSYNLTKELMSLLNPPTAIFCANNLTTLGCLKYLLEKNFVIGKDISIISFDEIEVLNFLGMSLSVVDRPVMQMGIEAVNLLNEKIDKKSKNTLNMQNTKKIIVDANLILRGSEKLSRFKN